MTVCVCLRLFLRTRATRALKVTLYALALIFHRSCKRLSSSSSYFPLSVHGTRVSWRNKNFLLKLLCVHENEKKIYKGAAIVNKLASTCCCVSGLLFCAELIKRGFKNSIDERFCVAFVFCVCPHT
jgi:hypothetical protein